MGFQDSMTAAECCILLAFLIIPYTDAQSWPSDVQQPANPTIVVEGVNSSEVSLVWGSPAKQGDIVLHVVIERGRPGGNQREAIALKVGANAFNVQPGFERDYVALLPLTLELRNVDNNEEYDYFVTFTYTPKDGRLLIVKSQIRVIVNVPPRITKEPARNSRVKLGQTLTLTCNASGDPMPNITWSKEGATTNQLVNATGYKLTLVNVQRKDVGSYRCTVNNGYGTASSLAIVNMICSQCNTTTVGITIREGAVWRDSLRNRESLEFKMLASNLTSAIVAPYSQPGNEGKQLYEVAIKEFRPGSVIAVVEMQFPRGIGDPIQPLRSEINDERLGIFTVNRELDLNPIPPRITKEPVRYSRVNAGQNLTLTCSASGDPMIKITWSREGATTNQLVNATGYKLTLVNVQRKDVGSYRCTAYNPYGTASSLAIVNLICSQCNTTTVGITIREGAVWRDALRNRESLEYKMLASNLTSAIVAPYSRPENEGNQLYEVAVREFRPGSVIAIVQMQFPRGISDPLQPLRSEMNDGRLGIFTVDRELHINRIPPRITREPARNSRVYPGQNLTLTCNASGAPVPDITWSREGANTNQLVNATGYKLTLVNVQRKDVGSYKCTANNPYGTASSLAIVNLICFQCKTITVGITIREGALWRDSLRNQESLEFKMLASNLTSAIMAPYNLPENEGKQLHEVFIEEFRPGSVTAIVQMQFPRDVSDPLLPLWSEMNDGRLGIFTVDRELQVNPSLYIIICDDMYTDLAGFAENDPAIKNSCSSSSFSLLKKTTSRAAISDKSLEFVDCPSFLLPLSTGAHKS